MKLKTNAVVGAVFLALLAFVYFYEIKGGQERQAEAEKSKKLLADYAPNDARRLVVDRGDTVIVLEKTQDEWKISAPVADLADQEAVERYLRNIDETERERVVADSAAISADAAAAGKYGLDQPRLKVAIETDKGPVQPLHFGGDSPTERFAYAQTGGANPEVFSVRAYRFDNLNKGLFDLRDRRVLAFVENEVKEVRLQRGDEHLSLARADGDQWQLQTDVAVAADKDAVNELVHAVQEGKIIAFTDEEPDSTILGKRGLGTTPLVDLTLVVGNDRAEKRLQVGHLSGHGYYARDLSRPAVFTIDTTLVAKLYQSVYDLRAKKPLEFDQESITQIEWHRDNETVIARKDTAGQWGIFAPLEGPARSWKVSGLLGDLNDIEVEDFVGDQVENLAAYSLDPALVKVRLLAADKEMLEVRLAASVGGQAFLHVGGTPSVYLVKEEVLENVNLSLDDIAQPPPASKEDGTASGE